MSSLNPAPVAAELSAEVESYNAVARAEGWPTAHLHAYFFKHRVTGADATAHLLVYTNGFSWVWPEVNPNGSPIMPGDEQAAPTAETLRVSLRQLRELGSVFGGALHHFNLKPKRAAPIT